MNKLSLALGLIAILALGACSTPNAPPNTSNTGVTRSNNPQYGVVQSIELVKRRRWRSRRQSSGGWTRQNGSDRHRCGGRCLCGTRTGKPATAEGRCLQDHRPHRGWGISNADAGHRHPLAGRRPGANRKWCPATVLITAGAPDGHARRRQTENASR